MELVCKVWKAGQGSLIVTFPRDFVQVNNISYGDLVTIDVKRYIKIELLYLARKRGMIKRVPVKEIITMIYLSERCN